jgi:PAS domain S-box-containing protein
MPAGYPKLDASALRGVIENAMDAMFVTDFSGTVILLNRSAEEMFRVKREDVIGSDVNRFVPMHLRDAHTSHMKNFAEGGVTTRSMHHPPDPVPALRGDGTEFLIEATISRDLSNLLLTVCIRDVTARVKSDIEKEKAMKAKEEFLGVVSHELRTPLSVIIAYTEVLLDRESELLPDQKNSLKRIDASARILSDLIDDILAQSMSDAVHPAPRTFQVAVAAHSAIDHIAVLAFEKGLLCECERGKYDLHIEADERWVGYILLNLLKNSIKYTENGNIRVSFGSDKSSVEERIWIKIEDTGIGIPTDKLEVIFDPFVQVDRHSSPALQGVGLGLSTARKLARKMGGDVTVKSEVGVGSTFTLTLPKYAPKV